MFSEVWERTVDYAAVALAFANGLGVQFIGGFILAACLIGGVHAYNMIEAWRANHKAKQKKQKVLSIRNERGRWMSTPEQENLEKVLMSDAITDSIEDLVVEGKMSPERAVIWYRRFANLLNLPDLLQKHETMLKEQIKKRSNIRAKTDLQNVKVIKFPDAPKASTRLARLRAVAAPAPSGRLARLRALVSK